jgi:hypothetical protein
MNVLRLRWLLSVLSVVGLPSLPVHAQPLARFDAVFTERTMRVDYFHTGGLGSEVVALDRIVSDGPWAGSRTRLLDDTNRGRYLFEVTDPETNLVLYSRGFSSTYGEWETTFAFRTSHQTFHESLRFPWPKGPVHVILKKRERGTPFREFWSTTVDPNSRFVNKSDVRHMGTVWTVFESGPPSGKVDLLVLGDGYTTSQLPKFHADVSRLVGALFETEPYKRRKSDFNVRALDLPTDQPGVNRPQSGLFRRTPLSVEYNIFDSERYVLTYDNRALHDVASAAPYEFIEILVNDQAYGGGGIFNNQATASVDTAYAEYVFIHEFGHHFADLGDEYYTSDVAYETGKAGQLEPWEPNLTALLDPKTLKWRDLMEPGTPLPTPWDKDAYDRHSHEIQIRRRELLAKGVPQSEIDALFKSEEDWSTKTLAAQQYSRKVGAFEGAGYESKGLYRPEADCIMFTRDKVGFCRPCARAIERIIDLYARP